MEQALFLIKKHIPQRVFLFFQPGYHFVLAFLAALIYWFPSRRLIVVGITGTKGKTTVVEVTHKILEQTGSKVASSSSLRFKIGGKEEKNLSKMTMPGRFFAQKFLRRAAREGCRYVLLEITSEAIRQFRHRFIKFDVAVITNIAPEHLESHGNMERYLRSKLDLFYRLREDALAIINSDDPCAPRFGAATNAHKMYYGRNGISLNKNTRELREGKISNNGISFEMEGVLFSSPLLGEFNLYNILAAVAIGLSQHIDLEKIKNAVREMSFLPGRMEFVQKKPFAVVVDYAHTPDSLEKVYRLLKNLEPSSRLICVLGATGGGRDKWKRKEFGRIAAQFCAETILTNEDPYDEDPEAILDEIEAGFLNHEMARARVFRKVLDRREAIQTALRDAGPESAVVITGKGAESWIMGPRNTKTPWDDRKVARQELKRLKSPLR